MRVVVDTNVFVSAGMMGPRGNPQARNLFGIIGYLQKQAGVELHVAAGPG
jgi:predicted nucleic acid-binding protein